MVDEKRLDDETLGAYVDGELDPVASEQVEAMLASDPDARERVASIRHISYLSALSSSLVAREPIPPKIMEAVMPDRGRRSRWGSRRPRWLVATMAASAALVLGLGIGISLDRNSSESVPAVAVSSDGWQTPVKRFYDVYADAHENGDRSLLEFHGDQKAELAAWFARHLGRDIQIPDLTHKQIELLGGRLLFAENGPVGQLMYVSDDNRLLGLTIVPTTNESDGSRIRLSSDGDMVLREDPGVTFGLTGAFDESELKSIAHDIEST